MSEQINIQIVFEELVEFNGSKTNFRDAIWFTKEEYDSKTEEEINVLKKERINNWINTMKNPVVQKE